MNTIVFSFPGNEWLAHSVAKATKAEEGVITFHQFPDKEILVRVESDLKNKQVIVVVTLNHPDNKILPLYFFCKKAKEDGATKIILIAPYLAYMRQDKSFRSGEVISSNYFAFFLSTFIDHLITVDPHLHRHRSLNEIFSIPFDVVQSTNAISAWIKNHVENPLLIGPDSESQQWVSQVADEIGAPFLVLNKERLNDRTVKISFPDFKNYQRCTPVILDDIISTGHTMIEAVRYFTKIKLKPPVCIAVHALFAGNAYEQLLQAGVNSIATCNTVFHESNKINLNEWVVNVLIKHDLPN